MEMFKKFSLCWIMQLIFKLKGTIDFSNSLICIGSKNIKRRGAN